jgi:predicted CXXCH cytochrome family protein
MLILLRLKRIKDGSVIEQNDIEVDAPRLRIGSGANADLQLFGDSVAPLHCLIEPAATAPQMQCTEGQSVSIDGRDVQQLTLEAGAAFQLGSHRLNVIAPPPGFDFGLEVNIDDLAKPSARQRYGKAITPRLPSARRWAYLLTLLVAVVGFGLPIAGYYNQPLGSALKTAGLPSDKLWSSGPLSGPHHLPGMTDNCNSCHLAPFEQVDNKACIACHSATTAHIPGSHHNTERASHCTSCHKEHNEPAMLVITDDALCVDCHHTPQLRDQHPEGLPQPATAEVAAASAFNPEQHPEFSVTLLQLGTSSATGEPHWLRQRQPLREGLRERSNLKFPHDLHLNGDKVKIKGRNDSSKRDMQCSDCHQLADDGEHFLPITMKDSCETCHSLSFNDLQPERRLPHGDTQELLAFLEDYYLSEAAKLDGIVSGELPRQVPNLDIQRRCEGLSILACGQILANQEVDLLFTKEGCISCHEAEKTSAGWQVKAVKLAGDWFSAARFDHRPHLVNNDTEVPCSLCHDASDSDDASDILMPALDSCTGCHGDRTEQVNLQCSDCHAFHRKGLPALTANPAEAE